MPEPMFDLHFTQQSASKDAADSAANEDSRSSSSQSNSKSPALVPSGDDAPRISPLIGLPSIMRPLFPGHGESVMFYSVARMSFKFVSISCICLLYSQRFSQQSAR
jgi:hypothetical protein